MVKEGMEVDSKTSKKNMKLNNKVYHWLMINLPFRVMYKHVWIDTQHKMWLPRWGWSNKQLKDAKEKVDKEWGNINWD